MTVHLLVSQLRFARSEFMRCLEGVSAGDAQRRLHPMNCLSWMVGHLANQEQRYWLIRAQGRELVPNLNELVGYGSPPTTPPLDEMLAAWRTITQATDQFLEPLTPEKLQEFFVFQNRPLEESVGTLLLRNIYHYWFHTGEAHAARQLMGHKDLPQFVGNINTAAYHPEE